MVHGGRSGLPIREVPITVEVHLLREGERIAQFRFVVLNRGAIIRFRSGQNPSEGEVVFPAGEKWNSL